MKKQSLKDLVDAAGGVPAIAHLSGLREATIYNLMGGRTTNPPATTSRAMADALGLSLDEFDRLLLREK
jgi:DNA-binding phage protein